MRISTSGLAFIADQEGFVPHVYDDVAGVPTIGFGHVMRHGDPTTVTRDQAMAMLWHDVASAESAVNGDVRVPLSQSQFDALVSFTFNLGTGALSSSTLLRLLNAGSTIDAAKQFLVWDHARVKGKLVVVEDLRKRRIAEATMFLGMDDDDARLALGLPVGPTPDETIRPVASSTVSPVSPETTQPTPPGDLPPGEDA